MCWTTRTITAVKGCLLGYFMSGGSIGFMYLDNEKTYIDYKNK